MANWLGKGVEGIAPISSQPFSSLSFRRTHFRSSPAPFSILCSNRRRFFFAHDHSYALCLHHRDLLSFMLGAFIRAFLIAKSSASMGSERTKQSFAKPALTKLPGLVLELPTLLEKLGPSSMRSSHLTSCNNNNELALIKIDLRH